MYVVAIPLVPILLWRRATLILHLFYLPNLHFGGYNCQPQLNGNESNNLNT